MTQMLTIDGRFGEGGGQILRTALGLSLVTGKPFTLNQIRGGRSRPGLLRQHLTAVRAATQISGASVTGDELRSGSLRFEPGPVVPGEYEFSVGSAGSVLLVLQAVLPALIVADGPSRLVLEGGTHNPWAPPEPFLRTSFLPVLEQMGATVLLELERPGFYPAGGGRLVAHITPTPALRPLSLERGPIGAVRGIASLAGLPDAIGERELKVLRRHLRATAPTLELERLPVGPSQGNIVRVEVDHGDLTACFVAFGRKGRRAERVAQEAADACKAWLARDVAVEEHLADQLLIPLALAGSGSFTTGPLSSHTETNMHTIGLFLRPGADNRRTDRR